MSTNQTGVISGMNAQTYPEKMPSMQNQPKVTNGGPGKMKHVRQLGSSVHVATGRAVLGHEKAYAGGALGLMNKTPFQGDNANAESKDGRDSRSGRGQSQNADQQFDMSNLNRSMQQTSYQSRPRKQGRMFGLALGQDDGPFKQKKLNGCPQVDKFATYSLQSIAANKTSPRIGILGATTFPSEREFLQSNMESAAGSKMAQSMMSSAGRIDDVSSSVNKQIKGLEDQLVAGYDLLQVFKEEADEIRKQIDIMMNVLVEKTEIVQDELHQASREDYKKLKADIKAQRDENEILYKGMKNLVKETESQRTKVGIFQAKVEELEQHVGILANSPDPALTTAPPILEEGAENYGIIQNLNEVTEGDTLQNLTVQNLHRSNINQLSDPSAHQQHMSQNNLGAGNSMGDIAQQKQQFPTMTVSNNQLDNNQTHMLH